MRWCCVVFLVVVLGAAVADTQVWWKTAVLYQVFPWSFKDSNGDGIGDLKGITQMAEYFTEIGVDAVWLSPIYSSPMVDQGYDVTNFTEIAPMFGTMQDFDELMIRFKELGIKIIMDFVPNHTSDEHEWFKKSVQNDIDYRNFYVWADPKFLSNGTRVPPNNWKSLFFGSAWEWSEQRQQYYFHQFTTKQPELNYRNPAVQGNMTAVINFWLDKGVDGFRIDAVPFLCEDENFPDEPPLPGTEGNTWLTLNHTYTLNQPGAYTLIHYWAEVLYNRNQQDGRPRIAVLEASIPEAETYYGQGTEALEFPFNFKLLDCGSPAVRASIIKYAINDWIDGAPVGGQLNWAVGTHDNPRVADTYGPEMIDAVNLLSGVLPGIKVTYYGEEIGMSGTFIRWDQTVDPKALNKGPDHYLEVTRDPMRTPMQWNDSVSAGFSENHITWLPVNPNYWWLNVNAQRNSDNSHLKVFQKMVNARKDPVLQFGDLDVIAPDNDTLLVIRNYKDSSFALLVNLGSLSSTYTSQDFFASYGLDVNMYVVVSSINAGYSSGQFMQRGFLRLTLRPKAAILLTTKTWTPSTTPAPTSAPTPATTGAPTHSGSFRLLAISPLVVFTVLLLLLLLQ